MSAVQFFLPHLTATVAGIAQPGAQFEFLLTGTTTPLTVYSNSGLTVARTNPVVCNGVGALPTTYLDNTKTYRLRIYDKDGALIDGGDIDPYIPGTIPDASVLQPYVDDAEDAAVAAAASAADASEDAETVSEILAALLAASVVSGASLNAVNMTALAALDTSANLPAILTDPQRGGVFTPKLKADYPNWAADTENGVYKASTFDATKVQIRQITGPLHPRHFGAPMDGTDDATAINAMFTQMAAEGWKAGYSMEGAFSIASGLTLDGGTFGNDLLFSLDFGQCQITALSAISRMLSIQDCYAGQFPGYIHFIGTNRFSNTNTDWTCDTGLWLYNCLQSRFGHIYAEAMGYAPVELDFSNVTNSNDCIQIGKIVAKRFGSGSPTSTMSRSANWSGAANTGVNGSFAQYTTITVDALPSTYAQTNIAGVPSRQVFVEISGQLCRVKNIDTGTNALQVYPWINTSSGTSGTLKYHYGAACVMRGNDGQLLEIGQISVNSGASGAEFGSLFGSNIGLIHAETSGSIARLGFDTQSSTGGVHVDSIYSEGNTFRLVGVSNALYNVDIGPQMGTDTQSDDYDASTSSTAGVLTASTDAFIPITLAADKGGQHFKTKRYSLGAFSETLDFSHPATFRGKCFYAPGALTLTLVAPIANLKATYAYDVAEISLIGSGTGGVPTGSITFTPPAGHTINGGAASASLVMAASSFTGPAKIIIAQTTATAWLIYQQAMPLDGYIGVAVKGNADATLTPYTDKVLQRFTTALTADRAVTLSTTGAREGNRFRVSRPASGAFNLNVGSGPLKALAASTWGEFVYDGSAWQLAAYGTL